MAYNLNIIIENLHLFQINVSRILVDGRMIPAANYGREKQDLEVIQLTDDEKEILIALKSIWEAILNIRVEQSTDFFATGAGSMDVVR
jgi:formyltetrahydrofolate dehydrogenase